MNAGEKTLYITTMYGSLDIVVIFLAFQIKHFVGDFALQNSWMVLGKGRDDWGFFRPLLAHAGIHSFLTLVVLLATGLNQFLWLVLADLIIHFVIDRLKSGPRYAGRFSMSESPQVYWFFFGLDQLLHQLTYIGFVWYIGRFLHG